MTAPHDLDQLTASRDDLIADLDARWAAHPVDTIRPEAVAFDVADPVLGAVRWTGELYGARPTTRRVREHGGAS